MGKEGASASVPFTSQETSRWARCCQSSRTITSSIFSKVSLGSWDHQFPRNCRLPVLGEGLRRIHGNGDCSQDSPHRANALQVATHLSRSTPHNKKDGEGRSDQSLRSARHTLVTMPSAASLWPNRSVRSSRPGAELSKLTKRPESIKDTLYMIRRATAADKARRERPRPGPA